MGRRAFLLVLALARIMVPTASHALTHCDQGPTVNPVVLGCAPATDPCIVLSHDAPAGCELDFGDRAVVFAGTFDVGRSALTVHAAAISVTGQLRARTDEDRRGGEVALTASAVGCGSESDDGTIVVSGGIDASGDPGGRVTLLAACDIELASGSQLVSKGRQSTSPNFASGGTITVLAGLSLVDAGDLDVRGGSGGGGGRVLLRAGSTLVVDYPIDASGGEVDGGSIDLLAGDDLTVLRNLDVRSRGAGGGGAISALAGVDLEGGLVPGGSLLIDASLLADGDSEADAGYDGGFISLGALGTIELTPASRIQASGGSPDGFGGVVTMSSGDLVPTRLGPLDGDIILDGTITLRGPGDGIGGELDLDAGRDAVLGGPMDLSGGFGGGELAVFAGRDATYAGALAVNGRGHEGTGGAVEMRAGGADVGAAHILASLDASGNSDDADADILLSGCDLTVEPGVTIDGRTAAAAGGGVIDLVARHAMTLGAASRYLATPAGPITLVHPPALVPSLAGAIFDPPATIETDDPLLLAPCPDCGDGVRQPGEICDPGAEADGACCNAECSAFLCPTPTRTPTPTPTPTGPTATPTLTASPTATPTATPGTPSPSATSTPLAPERKAVLRCAKTLAKSTATFVLTDLKVLEQCAARAFRCLQGTVAGEQREACLQGAGRRCQAKLAKLVDARARLHGRLARQCGGTPPVVPLSVMRDPDVLAFAEIEPVCQAETGLSLTSHGAIAACVQLAGACAVEESLGTAMPRLADALALLFPLAGTPFCLPSPLGDDGGLGATGPDAIRCQRALVTAGRQLLKRRLTITSQCVEKLLACRLSDPTSSCTRAAERCTSKLAALEDPGRGAAARLLGKASRACEALDLVALTAADGLGFDAAAGRCAALGVSPLDGIPAVAHCTARTYACTGDTVIRHALPLVDTELARAGLALPACP